MTRFPVIILLAACYCVIFPGIVSSQSVFSSDSLSNTGAVRPIDLIPMQQHWNRSSPDHFTYWLDSGLYGYYGPQPQLILDQLPVTISYFGWQNLNMMPIHLPDIEKTNTTVYRQSGLRNTPSGSIEFLSRKPKPGLSVGGSIHYGNESGDPGPWIYDSTKVTPNVDRWGPDFSGSISLQQNGWYARSSLSIRNHQQTDPRSHRRLHRTMRALGTSGYNKIQTTSTAGLIETGYRSESWNLKIRGIDARDDNYLFLQPLGREVPARATYRQMAVSGSRSHEEWTLDLQLIREEKELQRRNPEHDYIFNWDELTYSYGTTLSQSTDEYLLSSGFNWKSRDIDAPGISGSRYHIGTYFFRTELFSGTGHKSVVETAFDFSSESTARNIRGSLFLQLLSYWNLELSGSYNEVLPIQQESMAFWVTQGYTFFDELGIPYGPDLQITTNRLSTVETKSVIRLFIPLKLEVSIRYLNHSEQNIPWQEVSYSTNFDSEPGPFSMRPESGSRLQLYGSLIHTPTEWAVHQLSFQSNVTLEGSERYTNYYRQIPKAKATYQGVMTPVENLEISLIGRFQSTTFWKEFEALGGQEYRDVDNQFQIFTGTFRTKVPSHFNLDISAKKWLWNRRLNITLSVQNLLNDEVYMHPMGAGKSLLFNLKAEARF